jgi:hypothetical protein
MKEQKEERILNYTIKDLSIKEICPNSIDNVIISISDDSQYHMDLPSTMVGDSFKRWLQGIGGIFKKDIFNFLKGKPHGKYILMEGPDERSILRLIEDEEFPDFELKHLVHGKVKDKPYMILRTLGPDQSLTNNQRYILENPIIEEPEEEVSDENDNMPPKNEEDSLSHSVSLFTD